MMIETIAVATYDVLFCVIVHYYCCNYCGVPGR